MEEMGSLPQRAAMGTVREDYSGSGNAWDYFTHHQARSRAYRWGLRVGEALVHRER